MSLKEIVFHPAFAEYADKIREVRETYAKEALTESDTVRIYRAQGAVEALDKILEIPENERILGEEEGITGAGPREFPY